MSIYSPAPPRAPETSPPAATPAPSPSPSAAPSADAGTPASPAQRISRAWDAEPWAAAGVWPARWPVASGLSDDQPTAPAAPGLIIPVSGPLGAMRISTRDNLAVLAEQQHDTALMMSKHIGALGKRRVQFEREDAGSYIFLSVPDSPNAAKIKIPAAFYLKFISGREVARSAIPPQKQLGAEDAANPTRFVQLQRTWFVYYDPEASAAPGDQPKGVLVLMPGIFGTPDDAILPIVKIMRMRGWGVLRMLAQPSRFTETVTVSVGPADDLDAKAAQAADILTGRAAECAYAVEGAMKYLAQERPGAAAAPTCLLGMSGGAITLPTVLARAPERFQSAVAIAGGSDYLRITLDSNYTEMINAAHVDLDRALTPAQRENFFAAYRAHAPLDTIFTARALKYLPTLMIHGTVDKAVPAARGDEFWTLAGKPERWTFDLGHELLFMTVSYRASKIADWIEAHTNLGPAAPAPPAPPGAAP
ncbi:hypothetical protein BH11PLA1_BH11PLA1_15290 [soil metagenome]